MVTVYGDWKNKFKERFVPRVHCEVALGLPPKIYALIRENIIPETYIDSVTIGQSFSELATELPQSKISIQLNNRDGYFSKDKLFYNESMKPATYIRIRFYFDEASKIENSYYENLEFIYSGNAMTLTLSASVAIADNVRDIGYALDTEEKWTWWGSGYDFDDLTYYLEGICATSHALVSDNSWTGTVNYPLKPNAINVTLQKIIFGAGGEILPRRETQLGLAQTAVPNMRVTDAFIIQESKLLKLDEAVDYRVSATDLTAYPEEKDGEIFSTATIETEYCFVNNPDSLTATKTYHYTFDGARLVIDEGVFVPSGQVYRIWIPFDDVDGEYAYATVEEPQNENVHVRQNSTSIYGTYLYATDKDAGSGTITVNFYGNVMRLPYNQSWNLVSVADPRSNSISFSNEYGMPSKELLEAYVKNNTTFNFSWWCDPRIEAGDYILLHTRNGSVIARILTLRITYNGAFKATATARLVRDFRRMELYADDTLHLVDYAV